MDEKISANDRWMSEETQHRLADEMRRLKMSFKTFLRNEDGLALFRNLFQVFGRPPDGNSEIEFARFTGWMDVLNYIIHNSELLKGKDDE
jgi:hypothetical protein